MNVDIEKQQESQRENAERDRTPSASSPGVSPAELNTTESSKDLINAIRRLLERDKTPSVSSPGAPPAELNTTESSKDLINTIRGLIARDRTPSLSSPGAPPAESNTTKSSKDLINVIRRLLERRVLTDDEIELARLKEVDTCDSEVPLSNCAPGYPKLSGYMGLVNESMIFRKFGALNAQNLIYMQAELCYLEKQLRHMENVDLSTEHSNRQQYARDWCFLSRSKEHGDDRQWQLFQKIRPLLKEYNEALVHANTLLALPKPALNDLKQIQGWLISDAMGAWGIQGPDFGVWGSILSPKSHASDLATLCPRESDDAFSHWFTEKAIRYAFRLGLLGKIKRDSRLNWGYNLASDATLLQTTYILTSIIAALLPVASIVALIYVPGLPGKLAVIAGFNLVLSFCLTYFTSAKRTDIFSITAAFAAVQVVFVGVSQ